MCLNVSVHARLSDCADVAGVHWYRRVQTVQNVYGAGS